ncbi:MAG: ornithine carbamoyltransferase [Carboxydocellales bacterium]
MALEKNDIRKGLQGKDFISLHDFETKEILEMLVVATHQKKQHKQGITNHVLSGKTLGMIFRKSSTRTRVSFEVGIYQLGGQALFLNSNDIQLGRGEPISDTAQVLSRYVHGIMIRTFSHDEVLDLAKYASVPVINGLTDLLHPCQVLADLMTIQEHKGELRGLQMAYVGDGNNMAHSLMFGAAKTGMDITVATPEGYQPNPEVVKLAQQDAERSGSVLKVITDPFEAVAGADVVVTDVWASMGQEAEQQARAKVFAPYQINQKLVAKAKSDYIFLHCLPAHRGEEVTAEVIDGPHSVIFDEAENRLHAQKAIMALLM